MRRRLIAIIRKEFIHIFRDWRTLMIIILMPIMMIVLYGYAITLDMRNISFGVIDDARTAESRALVEAFAENGFFRAWPHEVRRADIEQLFMQRDVDVVIVIPREFSETLGTDRRSSIQLIIDAADSNVGTFVHNYSEQVLQIYNRRMNGKLPVLFELSPRIFYNPDMNSTNFFVPGLVALILMLISALLTSIAIAREKETGTMEQILVSPVHAREIVLGKVLPYVLLGLLNAAMIIVSARILFDVPLRGSLLLLGLMSLAYVFVALSFGLMISTAARTQLVAMFGTLMATILPTIMLSGFIFPIDSMPPVLQYIANVLPATYFLIIIRAIMLKGVGLEALWSQALILTGIGILLIAAATRRFRMRLE
ncbi:MAG: ABC transporter permease [Ignavibacteria bacterium]|nr:MAG: ABC transporter permease [Ignavibacteria bacterium]